MSSTQASAPRRYTPELPLACTISKCRTRSSKLLRSARASGGTTAASGSSPAKRRIASIASQSVTTWNVCPSRRLDARRCDGSREARRTRGGRGKHLRYPGGIAIIVAPESFPWRRLFGKRYGGEHIPDFHGGRATQRSAAFDLPRPDVAGSNLKLRACRASGSNSRCRARARARALWP